MVSLPERPSLTRRAAFAVAVILTLGLSACAGSGSATTTSEQSEATTTETTDGVEVPVPVALLPHETEVPPEFRMRPARCGSEDPGDGDTDSSTADDTSHPDSTEGDAPAGGSSERSDEADEVRGHATWLTYAVPEAWEATGGGSVGSGSASSTDEEVDFFVADDEGDGGGQVSIAVEWDSRDEAGTILDSDGEPWESFDYESSIGDETKTITYDDVAILRIAEQEPTLFYRDPSQAAAHIEGSRYKVRLEAFEIPMPTDDGGYELVPRSFVVTIAFDGEEASIEQETVEKIVGSFVLPECTWDSVVTDQELILDADLNGDGEIQEAQHAANELEEQQQNAEANLGEERRDSPPN